MPTTTKDKPSRALAALPSYADIWGQREKSTPTGKRLIAAAKNNSTKKRTKRK